MRVFVAAVRLAWPHLLAPWRSPLLRWRIETYGCCDDQGKLLTADQITPQVFIRFLLRHRSELFRFLSWAARLG